MEIEISIKDLLKDLDRFEWEVRDRVIKRGLMLLGEEIADYAKMTISTFVNKKGNHQGFDTGQFYNSITSEQILDGWGFKVVDGVDYGIYHEFGTEPHWLPFFDKNGNITGLGEWALRHFGDMGFEVRGKRGKALKSPTRGSKIEVLRKKGGIMVSLDEMAPFRKAMQHGKNEYRRIFRECFDDIAKGNA